MKFLLFLFSFLIAYFGYNQRYSFVDFSTAQGLPQSQVKCIAQDSTGFIWVGTLGGLSKFDGQNFNNFSTDNGLFNNRITSISFIGGKVFIGHEGGVSVSEDEKSFKKYSLPKGIDESTVTAIIYWRKEIYVATNGSGLFSLKNNKLARVDWVTALRIRDAKVYNNQLLLACRGEVYLLEETNSFSKLNFLPEASYSSINIHKGKISVSSYDYGVLSFNEEALTSNYVSDRYIQKKHGDWRFRGVVSTNESLYGYSKQGVVKFTDKRKIEINESSGLPVEDVSTVFIDSEQNVWIGTSGKGLLKFSGEVFTYFNQQTKLSSDLVLSVLEDKKGNFWYSAYDNDVTKRTTDNSFEYVQLPSKTVWSSIEFDNQLYFGSSAGLFVYKDGIQKIYSEENGLPGNKISALFKANGLLWIGTNKGIIALAGDSLISTKKNTTLTNVRSFSHFKDRLFCGSQTGLYLVSENGVNQIANTSQPVNSLVEVNKKLWVGTEDGLYYYDGDNLVNFKLAEQAGASYINFLVAESTNIFVGTNNGLYKISENNEIFHFGINDGLVDLESNLNSGYLDKQNQIWFGTASGLVKFDLSQEQSLHTLMKPRIVISSVQFNNEKLNIFDYSEGKSKHGLPINLSLPYNKNNISIDFIGLYFTNPQSLMYEYQLLGASEDWVQLDKTSEVNLTNLSSGEYTLRLRVSTDIGMVSDIAEYSFEVRTAWYYSWWFILLCIVLIAILVGLALRLRIKRIEEKSHNEKLEFKNRLIALEQQSLNASMNRHFIFNSLNSIQYFINVSDKKSANKYLTNFAQLIRKNLDSSNEGKGTVALAEEIERLELYLKLEMMRFQGKFDYKINIDPEAETELIEVPAMLLQPFVENSIIHGVLSLENDKGLIEINVKGGKDYVEVEIIDNGIGIDASRKGKVDFEGDHKSQGMEITQGRIEILQKISQNRIELIGPYQVSENDGGTTVKVQIPLLDVDA